MFTMWELAKLSLAGVFSLGVIGALIYAIVTS
jgi:preprotein translocase subunit Sss1